MYEIIACFWDLLQNNPAAGAGREETVGKMGRLIDKRSLPISL